MPSATTEITTLPIHDVVAFDVRDLEPFYEADIDGDGKPNELNLGCEACHGPGSDHVLWAQKKPGWERFESDHGLVLALDERKGVNWVIDPETGDVFPPEGSLVIGTVQGDIHDIGKDVVVCRQREQQGSGPDLRIRSERVQDLHQARTLGRRPGSGLRICRIPDLLVQARRIRHQGVGSA